MYATGLLAKLTLANLDSTASCMDENNFSLPMARVPGDSIYRRVMAEAGENDWVKP